MSKEYQVNQVEKIRIFDEIVHKAIVNLYSSAKNSSIIYLSGFNPKKKDHLFLYHCAQLCAQINHFSISSDLNGFKRFIFNYKNKKRLPIKKFSKETLLQVSPVDVDVVLSFMEVCFGNTKYTYSDIYNEYWGR